MRLFAAASTDDATPRKAAPADILRRLAFGRPQGRTIQPAPPTASVPAAEVTPAVEVAPKPCDDGFDLAQRVRLSGEW